MSMYWAPLNTWEYTLHRFRIRAERLRRRRERDTKICQALLDAGDGGASVELSHNRSPDGFSHVRVSGEQRRVHATNPCRANRLDDGIGHTLASVGGRSPEEPGGMDGGVVARRAPAGADARRRPTPKYDGQRVGIAPWVLWGSSIRGRSGVGRPRSPCRRTVALRNGW